MPPFYNGATRQGITHYNQGKPYRDQVRPFNFLLSFQAQTVADSVLGPIGTDLQAEPAEEQVLGTSSQTTRRRTRKRTSADAPHAVAPYDRTVADAVQHCFDRQTGQSVPAARLQSYREALAQYYVYPEAKFANADYTDMGVTTRRHIVATSIEYIGKEANRWEEQFYLGEMPEAQISYGTGADGLDQLQEQVLCACRGYTVRELARTAGLSVGEVSAVLQGKGSPSHQTLTRLLRAAQEVEARRHEEREQRQAGSAALRKRCQRSGVRQVARDIGVDPANLTRVLTGRRRLSLATMRSWEASLHYPQQ